MITQNPLETDYYFRWRLADVEARRWHNAQQQVVAQHPATVPAAQAALAASGPEAALATLKSLTGGAQ